MDNYFFISNNYKTFENFNKHIKFNNYLNNIIIQDDFQFFKFVKNYDKYINEYEPILYENIFPFQEYDNITNYCFIHIDDIEFIFIYKNKDNIINEFKNSFNKNLTPVFFISISLLHQYHDKIVLDDLIDSFIKIKNIIFLKENISNLYIRNYYKCHISHYKFINYQQLLINIINLFFKNIYFSTQISKENIILKKNVVCISSILKTSDNPLLGVNTRSVFTPVERLNQTILQINSIRKKIPDCTIILLEKSKNISIDFLKELNYLIDYLILYNDDELLNYYANEHFNNKGLPELYVTNHFCKLIKNLEFNHFFKFAGRVNLSDSYNANDFINEIPVACTVYDNYSKFKKLAYSSSFVLPKKYIDSYIEHTNLFLNKDNTIPAEYMITLYLESLPKYLELKKLNVEFFGGTTGVYLYI